MSESVMNQFEKTLYKELLINQFEKTLCKEMDGRNVTIERDDAPTWTDFYVFEDERMIVLSEDIIKSALQVVEAYNMICGKKEVYFRVTRRRYKPIIKITIDNKRNEI